MLWAYSAQLFVYPNSTFFSLSFMLDFPLLRACYCDISVSDALTSIPTLVSLYHVLLCQQLSAPFHPLIEALDNV
jgi:hypothetical protein